MSIEKNEMTLQLDGKEPLHDEVAFNTFYSHVIAEDITFHQYVTRAKK